MGGWRFLVGLVVGLSLSAEPVFGACEAPFEDIPLTDEEDGDSICLYVNLPSTGELIWEEANKKCHEDGGSHLLALPTDDVLEKITDYIHDNVQGRSFYTLWVGGTAKMDYTWPDGSGISDTRHIWYPDAPWLQGWENRCLMLIPYDTVHQRLSLADYTCLYHYADGYVCQYVEIERVFLAQVSLTREPRCEAPFDEVADGCYWVEVEPNGINYNDAKTKCEAESGTMASFTDTDTMTEVSHYIDRNFVTETEYGYLYWAGGEGVNNEWTWPNGDVLDVRSHMWSPNHPVISPYPMVTTLIALDNSHGRRYLQELYHTEYALGFICETEPSEEEDKKRK